MIGERFELDGRSYEVIEETQIVSYTSDGRELRYTAQAVRRHTPQEFTKHPNCEARGCKYSCADRCHLMPEKTVEEGDE